MKDDTVRATQLVRPTLTTGFHVDFDWWGRNDRELRVYLRSHLCPAHQETFAGLGGEELIDWVDPDTGEVQRVDGMRHTLMTHCARQPDYLEKRTSLVDSVFRVFLANGNTPLNSEELSEKVGRPARTILRTLSRSRVYKGLRPILDP